jgi:phage nucleotide-binding protein
MEAAAVLQDHPIQEKLEAVKLLKEIDFLNILIYGDPGVGKTYLLGTAEDHIKTSPVLLIEVEGGAKTIRHRNIDVVPARTLTQVQKVLNTLILAGDDLYYKTVCLDSLSELQKLDMRFIMKQAKEASKNPDKFDIDVPSQREWGKSLEHTRAIVRAFRDLPCNTILTALAADKSEDGKVIEIFPSLPGKARNEIPGFMDIVGYYYAQQQGPTTVRRLQLAKTRKVSAKDRTGMLGEMMEEPTIPAIFDAVHKGE